MSKKLNYRGLYRTHSHLIQRRRPNRSSGLLCSHANMISMRSGDKTNSCILSDHRQLIYDPIVISPLLTLLFSKEWIELNCIEYFSSGNLPRRFFSRHWCICVLLLPKHRVETDQICAGDPAGSCMSIM